MATIQDIFNKALYRIPDYQRGYSWKAMHLDDFWQDLQNLQPGKKHYTGDITLEECTGKALNRFKADKWLLGSQDYKPYYVVDGQQRLTTVVILLKLLLDQLEEHELLTTATITKLTEKYLYKSNSSKNLISFVFGYEVDDPSYEYLKTKIFRQESTTSQQPETSYTNNLGACKTFFQKRLQTLPPADLRTLFEKVTGQLLFDIKYIGELDKFVVFETMNNRGKALSNLEKLKNRFIYLSTLLPKTTEAEADALRQQINDVWKSCYEYLGKNKSHVLNDDIFLRNHFILFHFYNKENGFPFRNIFKDIYTVPNILAGKKITQYKALRNYIGSLQKAVVQWYYINNPEQALANHCIELEEARWLIRLNRMGWRVFGPLTLSVYLTTTDLKERVTYLKEAEAFMFLNYICAGKRNTFGMSELSNLATRLYQKEDGCTVKDVTERLNNITYGDEDSRAAFTIEKFIETIKDQFGSSKKSGYYDWARKVGAKYFLFEYEDFLRGKEEPKVDWNVPDSIEHIYPQNPTDKSWLLAFKGFSAKQKHILQNSLGNLLLLNRSKNSTVSNRPFVQKKEFTYSTGNTAGYVNGSHSEIQVAKEKDWNARRIYLRGLAMLQFFEKRWRVTLTSKQKKALLLIEESLMKKIR